MKYAVFLSLILAFSGVVLLFGSLYTVSYTVRERVRVDMSRVHVDEAFVVMPATNRSYLLDSIIMNTSIIQVDVNSSDFIVLKIINEYTDELSLERRTSGERVSFWTPPNAYDVWRFVFANPSSPAINVAAKITEFQTKATGFQDVTHYRPLLDPIYGYNGLIAILISTGLSAIQNRPKPENRTNQTIQ